MAEFRIRPVGPFSWSAAVDVVGHFAPVRRFWVGDPTRLVLAFPLDGTFAPAAVELSWDGAEVVGTFDPTLPSGPLRRQVARIFSLDHDGRGFPDVGARDPRVGQLMRRFPGLRPVCFPSPYETAVWSVLSNRIRMDQAAVLLDRIIAHAGTPLLVGGRSAGAFPAPSRLRSLPPVDGLPPLKRDRLIGVARAALDGRLDAEALRELGREGAVRALREIPGIGPFWSEGIYLRGCGIVDEFPTEPLSIAALGRLHGLGDSPDAQTVQHLTDVYRPFRMWVAFLLRVSAGRGLIPSSRREGGEALAAARATAVPDLTEVPEVRAGARRRQ